MRLTVMLVSLLKETMANKVAHNLIAPMNEYWDKLYLSHVICVAPVRALLECSSLRKTSSSSLNVASRHALVFDKQKQIKIDFGKVLALNVKCLYTYIYRVSLC